MASRERKVFVKPEEWFGAPNDAYRAKVMKEARKDARRHLALVMIIVKDRVGSQIVARIDARYWLFDENGVDKPPPDFQEIKRREASAERTKRLKPPKGLFD